MQLPSKTIQFPSHSDIVYVIGFLSGSEFVPFYVGESSCHLGRLGNYVSGKFSAQTDFKVAVAVRFLRQKGFEVVMKYEETEDRKRDERELLKDLRQRYCLLNDRNLKGYDYRFANEIEERKKIEDFVQDLASTHSS